MVILENLNTVDTPIVHCIDLQFSRLTTVMGKNIDLEVGPLANYIILGYFIITGLVRFNLFVVSYSTK